MDTMDTVEEVAAEDGEEEVVVVVVVVVAEGVAHGLGPEVQAYDSEHRIRDRKPDMECRECREIRGPAAATAVVVVILPFTDPSRALIREMLLRGHARAMCLMVVIVTATGMGMDMGMGMVTVTVMDMVTATVLARDQPCRDCRNHQAEVVFRLAWGVLPVWRRCLPGLTWVLACVRNFLVCLRGHIRDGDRVEADLRRISMLRRLTRIYIYFYIHVLLYEQIVRLKRRDDMIQQH